MELRLDEWQESASLEENDHRFWKGRADGSSKRTVKRVCGLQRKKAVNQMHEMTSQ